MKLHCNILATACMVILGAKVHEGPWKLPMSQNYNLSYLLVGRQPYRTMNLTPSVSHLNTGNQLAFPQSRTNPVHLVGGWLREARRVLYSCLLCDGDGHGLVCMPLSWVAVHISLKSRRMPRKYTWWENYQTDKRSWKLQGKVDQVKIGIFSLSLEVRASLHIWEPSVQGSVVPFLVGW